MARRVALALVMWLCVSSSTARAEVDKRKTALFSVLGVGVSLAGAGAGLLGYSYTEYYGATRAATLDDFRRMTRESSNFQTAGTFMLAGGALTCVIGTVFTTLFARSAPRRPALVTPTANGVAVRF
jgi:hypothetical protein